MTKYLSIQEAIDLTGRSDKSIRRLCAKAKKGEKKYIKGKLFVLDTFLYSEFPPILDDQPDQVKLVNKPGQSGHTDQPSQTNEPDAHTTGTRSDHQMMISILTEQLNTKDKQIDNLNERLREAQINLQTLQQSIKALPTHKEMGEATRVPPTDKLLYGVAIAAIFALLVFVFAMIYAFFRQK